MNSENKNRRIIRIHGHTCIRIPSCETVSVRNMREEMTERKREKEGESVVYKCTIKNIFAVLVCSGWRGTVKALQ